MIAGGHRSEAIRYLENLRQLSLNSNPIQIGVSTLESLVVNSKYPCLLQFQCPRENIFCKAVEFDNIKVFYHRTYPDPSQMDIWNFYIGRPGTSASQCIDWAKEGIKVEVCGPTGKWGITTALVVPPSTRVRIMYNFKGMRRTHELIFPSNYTSVPTTYLEPM